MPAVFIILALTAVVLAVILIRAALFVPRDGPQPSVDAAEFDREAAQAAQAALVRCKTVSCADPSLEDDGEFAKLTALLPELYPHVAEVCPMQRLPDRGLLFHWKGKAAGEPAVLMAHYDVVPVEEENWEKPPFSAVVEDGVMWGRGTLDTKVTFNGILSAADALISQGFTPENDIYFAFSGGEEVAGRGAVNIVNWFGEHGIVPALVLDEGWRRVVNAVSATWPGSAVSPYLMVQCSDSRHYRDLSDRVYRFSAMDLTGEERATIHGNNERIQLEVVHRAVEFFIRLMRQC